jgi:ornithine carbamoyltransferase
LGEREPIADFARVVERYLDGLVVRTFEEQRLEELIQNTDLPVINALTDESHPCQAMADMLTLVEHLGELKGKMLVYVGDSNNVSRSLLRAASKLGLGMRIVSPVGYEFSEDEKEWGRSYGFEFLNDPNQAVAGADALYTDVWTSMGQEKEKEQRLKDFQGFCIDENLLGLAKSGAKVLHCLPAHRGEEISAAVMESGQSAIFDQAENRLHAQKAVMVSLMKK